MSEPKKEKESVEVTKSGIQFTRAEDFIVDYANHTLLESSNWDLRITFGHLDQSLGPNNVVQTTAVTIPWAQAKVLHYFLTLHLIGHEGEYGRLIIPPGIINEFPKDAPLEVNKEAFQKAAKFAEEFMAENREAKPRK